MIKEAKTYAKPAKIYGEPAKIYGEAAKIYGEAFILKEKDQQEVNKYLFREFSKEMKKYPKKTRIIDNPLFWFIISFISFLLLIYINK